MHLSVTPVLPVRRIEREEGRLDMRKPVDSKVRGLVLDKICQTQGALLPSAAVPQIITFLLPGFEPYRRESMQKKRKTRLRRTPLPRKIPIGLMPVDLEGWVNALMQFILYIPGFAENFTLAPKSLSPIQEFVDQYHQDLVDGKSVSSAGGAALFRLFTLRFPSFSLSEIFEALMHLLIPKWALFRTVHETPNQRHLPDLFFCIGPVKKQIYMDQYYDLGAFIERRPDGARANYIAYVKVDGCWYQCDNDRITHLRSDMLSMPLQRGILSHYRQVILEPVSRSVAAKPQF